ncbi:COX15/CtaA family protein [Thermopirellula anaerolimosa]
MTKAMPPKGEKSVQHGGNPPSHRGIADPDHDDVPRLPHRLAWALTATVFPLIWMGGLVTTYNAGMAVPDWPNTYGYNLFLYPVESWLKTWDVFLEHSHRLIGATAGFITIALLWSLWVHDRRPWMRNLGIAALLGVSLQGALGGLRVVGQEILLANVHGCVAPLFFAFTVSLTVLTSPRWRRRERSSDCEPNSRHARGPTSRNFHAVWIVSLPILVYLQIILGAQLRHMPPELPPGWSFLWTILHLTVAALLPILWAACYWFACGFRSASGPRRWLQAFGWLLALQITLGLGTWVVNYNFPRWFQEWIVVIPYTVVQGGLLQAVVTTAHSATGSALLAVAVAYAHWALSEAEDLPPDRGFTITNPTTASK